MSGLSKVIGRSDHEQLGFAQHRLQEPVLSLALRGEVRLAHHDRIDFAPETLAQRQEGPDLELFGAIDDLWRDLDTGELIVADYKATSKTAEVTLDADWQIGYKRQMEFYQWLLRGQGLTIARRGWFVYCNGRRDLPEFGGRLEFRISMIPYEGDDAWVEETLDAIVGTLRAPQPPAPSEACEYCAYVAQAGAP